VDPYTAFRQQHVMSPNPSIVRRALLDVIDAFVTGGADSDSRGLGAMYVLTALTLVSDRAALSLPWLYESAVHIRVA
jgi:hypothetical protein